MLLTLYYCWWVSIAQYQSFPCTLLARDHACYLKLFLFNSLGLKETKMESMLTHSWTRIWVGLAADGLGYWLCVGIKHPQVIQQETAQHVKHSLDLFQVCVCVCVYWACVIDEARHAGFDLELYFIQAHPTQKVVHLKWKIFIELINW